MTQIDLGNGKFTIIDDQDFDLLSRFRWRHVAKQKKDGAAISEYAVTSYHNQHVTMQWLIMGNLPHGCIIDHKDRNGLNNQRDNLRFCVAQSNRLNSKRKLSQYKGVSQQRPGQGYKLSWCASCQYQGKKLYKRFATEIEAAKGYDEMAKQIHGNMAYLNFPNEKTPQDNASCGAS